MSAKPVRFCPYCGVATKQEEYAGKSKPICPQCGWIYFPDPKVGAAVLIVEEEHILLVRRVHEPNAGKWALPAGFVDANEDPAQAARRECLEETGLDVEITGLLSVLFASEHARGADILITYCARVTGGKLQPGDDADGAHFFPLNALPPLAFETTQKAILNWRSSSSH